MSGVQLSYWESSDGRVIMAGHCIKSPLNDCGGKTRCLSSPNDRSSASEIVKSNSIVAGDGIMGSYGVVQGLRHCFR
jgi:hypothetical protein